MIDGLLRSSEHARGVPATWHARLFAFIHSFDDVVLAEVMSGTASATLPKTMWSSLLYSIEPTLSAISTLLVPRLCLPSLL